MGSYRLEVQGKDGAVYAHVNNASTEAGAREKLATMLFHQQLTSREQAEHAADQFKLIAIPSLSIRAVVSLILCVGALLLTFSGQWQAVAILYMIAYVLIGSTTIPGLGIGCLWKMFTDTKKRNG